MACKPKEDHDAPEATYTRRDRGQVTPGRCSGRARNPGHGRDPRPRSHGGRLRDELLDGEIFYTLREARVVIESWRRHDNTIRPHASLGYRPPAPEVSCQLSPPDVRITRIRLSDWFHREAHGGGPRC